MFTRTDTELAVAIVIYGFLAAALPAWMLLAPRDNISTYLKVGTVALLAVGILFARPAVQMPAVTRFVDGSGPIFGGGVFPVLLHHHRLRRDLGLPLPDQQRDDAALRGPRERHPRRGLRRAC